MPKIVDKQAKRNAIMDAALQLFLEKGYKSVTTREIAAHANVSKGVLYDYFKSKEDLFYETIRENMLKKLMYKAAMLEEYDSPGERFQKLKDFACSHAETRKQRFHLMFDFIVNCQDQKFINDVLGNLFDVSRSYTAQILSEAFPEKFVNEQSAQLYATIITVFINGMFFQHYVDPKRINIEKALDVFWKLLAEELESKPERIGTPAS